MKKAAIIATACVICALLTVSVLNNRKPAAPAVSETQTEEEAHEETRTEPAAKVEYISESLGFRAALPELLQEKMSVVTEEREVYGETVTLVSIYYEGEETQANVLSFEEMSKEVWQKMQEEGGPLGRELGVSKQGRVVVLNTIQSNPYEEGSKDFEILQELPKQLGVIEETFIFIEED